jgi:hypothetical protein
MPRKKGSNSQKAKHSQQVIGTPNNPILPSHNLFKMIVNPPKEYRLKRAREIPYLPIEWGKGTQIPTFRLYSDFTLVTSSAGNVINTVISIDAAQFSFFSSAATIFDEYRPIRGGVQLDTLLASTQRNGVIVGVIDYDDATALTTTQLANHFDTKKIVNLERKEKPYRWAVMFDATPDKNWLTTATTNTLFAAWKAYGNSSGGVPASTDVALVSCWIDFQFRCA